MKNEVTIKYKWSTNEGHHYRIILNGQYDKEILVSERECIEQRCSPEDMIQLKVSNEMSKLGISQDNFIVSVL